MKLALLSVNVFSPDVYGDLEITLVTDRSDAVVPGALFVAIPGRTRDGHDYLRDAVRRGAAAVVVSRSGILAPVPCFTVPDSRRAYALLCGNFQGNPSKDLILTGITGTNGKTSTAYMLDHCLRACGKKTGLIGTVRTDDGSGSRKSSLTTPDPSVLHSIFAGARLNGCTHVVMEVSSQSLDQARTAGILFDLGIFTNLTVDHLDYHGSMQSYRDCKLKLFSQVKQGLVNADSDYAAPFLACPSVLSFSASHPADFTARCVRMTGAGVSYLACSPSGRREVFLPVWGRFSIYNSLAALAAAEMLGLSVETCVEALARFPGVPGRLEPVRGDLPFRFLIDYAHTPDGLENVLQSLRETTAGDLIAVFGCGGDRDAGKRSEMGRIATRLAHKVIVTSDNPRSEDPEEIIRQIVAGAEGDNYEIIPDRTQAIRRAVRLCRRGDTLLLAGKGHETWQIFADRVLHYDEREVAREILREEGY